MYVFNIHRNRTLLFLNHTIVQRHCIKKKLLLFQNKNNLITAQRQAAGH